MERDNIKASPGKSIPLWKIISGIILIWISFLIYPLYAVIPFLPFSSTIKIVVATAGFLISWALFSAGVFLAGKGWWQWISKRKGWF